MADERSQRQQAQTDARKAVEEESAAKTQAVVEDFQRQQEAARQPAEPVQQDGARTERQQAQIDARKKAEEDGAAKSAAITEETTAALAGVKPTPTPDEIQAAIRGENVMVKEDDGSGPERLPGQPRHPPQQQQQRVMAPGPAAQYRTRAMTDAPDAAVGAGHVGAPEPLHRKPAPAPKPAEGEKK